MNNKGFIWNKYIGIINASFRIERFLRRRFIDVGCSFFKKIKNARQRKN